MNASQLCERVKSGLSELFECEPHGEFLRIRTPFLYPDGDVIDLFLKQGHGASSDIINVTDLGETTRWLRSQTLSPRRSPKQSMMLQDICLNHGVECYKGMLFARCRSLRELPDVALRVSQAAVRVSDISLTFRTRSVQQTTDEVADFLEEQDLRFQRGESLSGRSGRAWKIDFHVRTARISSLACVLSTGSRSAARGVAEHVLATWVDLNQLRVGPEPLQFVSLFDDTVDVWNEEDFRLLEEHSLVSRWSRPDDFAEILVAA